MNTKYTYLKYYPKEHNDESIVIGIVLHDYINGKLYFDKIKKLKRVLDFDDEIDQETLKKMIDYSFRYFESLSRHDLFSDGNQKIYQKNFLEESGKFYLNKIRFSSVNDYEVTADIEKEYVELKDITLYYDKNKSERATEESIKTVLSRIIKGKEKVYTNNVCVQPNGFEKLKFDFEIIDSKTKYIKILKYNENLNANAINSLKSWIYNMENFFVNKDVTFVFPSAPITENEKYQISLFENKHLEIQYLDSIQL